MAATKTAKGRTSRNDTPNTPDVSESKIARMKVDELRRALGRRGVKGTDDMKKPDLVTKLIKAEKKSAKSGKTASRSTTSGKTASRSSSSRKNPTSRNDTPDTPQVDESKIARMKVADLRTRLARRGVKGTDDMKKPDLVTKLIKAEKKSAKSGKTASRSASNSRKNPTSRNDTPDTPEVSESKIARMKVADLRTRLARRGVKGTDDMKKPELVTKLIKAELKSAKSGKTASRSASSSRKNPTSRNDTPDTPEVSESKIARMKVAELRTRLSRQGVDDTAGLKKPELVKKLVKTLTGKGTRSSARKRTTKTTTGKRTAKAAKSSDSERSADARSRPPAQQPAAVAARPQRAERPPAAARPRRAEPAPTPVPPQPAERPPASARPRRAERSPAPVPGGAEPAPPEGADRSLATTDHDVIRQWAKSRRAVPAHVAGTQHDGELGELRFDLAGNPDERLVEVSWAEWFEAFDKRRLTFVYQQWRSGGERSNIFELRTPDE